MNYILLIVGFLLLIKGADIFVDGASSIAKILGIPPVIVGLTIVSIGTSAPELAVSIISSLQGSNEIAIGNVIGSNLFNTLMVLGVTTIVLPLIIKKDTMKVDFMINILVTFLLFILTFGKIFNNDNIISRIDGLILAAICVIYMIFLIIKSKKTNISKISEDEKNIRMAKKIIAYSLGMSEKLVGLTIVAMGTSLPELVTSVVAATKGENDIALGNVLGSNIFNILLILGVSSAITPIPVAQNLIVDFVFLLCVSIFIFALIIFSKGKEKKLTRIEGIVLVVLYIGYIIYIINRN